MATPVRPLSPRARPSGPRIRRTTMANVLEPVPPSPFPASFSGSVTPSDESAPAYFQAAFDSPSYMSRPHSPRSPATPGFFHGSEESFGYIKPTPLLCEKGIQVDPPDPHLPPSAPGTPSSASFKVLAKTPTLTPPPALNFDHNPVRWRGLTLEAAQWSLSSEELQKVVSRAIRSTAHESFIRLLPSNVLDEEMAQELERLETLKVTTQSQYRFNMHRRTMLLQSLNSLSGGGGDFTALANLTSQLAEITVACDRLMEELIRIGDHRAQIQKCQDVHVASALAMALRKLNGSYAKRTAELRAANVQIEQLKGQLEDAWQTAEDMAREMDDLDNFHSGFSSEADETDFPNNDESANFAQVINITGTGVVSKAMLTSLDSPVVDIGSPRKDLEQEKETDHATRVSMAKRRSSRASRANLRVPKSSDQVSLSPGKRSRSIRAQAESTKQLAAKPVLALEVGRSSAKGGSFLDLIETRPVSPATPAGDVPPPLPNSVHIGADSASTMPYDIPPIAVHSPRDDDHGNPAHSQASSFRHSEEPVARPRSSDNSEIGFRRPVSNAKQFDGWPLALGKLGRRRSAPLSDFMSMAGMGDFTEGTLLGPPSRVFSVSPQPRPPA